MQYAMLLCGEEAAWYEAPAEQIEQAMNAIYAWHEKWSAEGKIAEGGAELDSVRTAKTVRPGPDGEPMVTDGPYLELKDVIGGIVMLNAESMDEAVAIAATWPGIASHGDKVEVRPVMQH